jgi:hypothetical protein
MKYQRALLCGIFFANVFSNVALASETLTANVAPKKSPVMGVNLEPVYLVLGGLGAKMEYFVSDSVSLGLGGVYVPKHNMNTFTSTSSSSTTTDTESYMFEHNEIFVGSNIMLTGTLGGRGAYLNPAVGYASTRISEYSSSKLSGQLSTPMARLTGGYQWVLVDHLRLAAGGGFTVAQSGTVIVKDSNGAEVLRENSSSLGGLALDLQVGYVF